MLWLCWAIALFRCTVHDCSQGYFDRQTLAGPLEAHGSLSLAIADGVTVANHSAPALDQAKKHVDREHVMEHAHVEWMLT